MTDSHESAPGSDPMTPGSPSDDKQAMADPVEAGPPPAPAADARNEPAPTPSARKVRMNDLNGHPMVKLVVGVAALAGLAAFGTYSVMNQRELARRIAGGRTVEEPIPKRYGEEGNEGSAGAGSSRLVIIRGGNLASGRPALVALRTPTGGEPIRARGGARQGVLARELVRQAVLIAARDELGLTTRDEVLGDRPAVDPAQDDTRIEVVPMFQPGQSSRAVIRQTSRESVETLLDHDLGPIIAAAGSGPGGRAAPDDLPRLVETAEAMSRGEIPSVLRKLGLAGQRNGAGRKDVPLPAWAEESLAQRLSFCEPLAVVRSVHAAIGQDGETPSRLGALARGYALLGILSEFQWHPAHKAFKARALLYAQRLVTRDPADPRGYWYRAYAEALVGLHARAQADLAAASQRAGGTKPPEWVPLIDAAARGDARRLGALAAKGPFAPLAALLRLTVLEYPALPGILLPAARQVLTVDPACFRACDAMCEVHGLNNQHQATMLGPRLVDEIFPSRLRRLAAVLPQSVRAELDKGQGVPPELVSALVAAGDPASDDGEPSWAVLGHLLRETRFMHAYRRLFFKTRVWGVPVDDEWPTIAPTVADHRFRPILDLFVLAPRQSTRSLALFIEQVDLSDLDLAGMEFVRGLSELRSPRLSSVFDLLISHTDHVARDLSAAIRSDDNARGQFEKTGLAWTLLSVSPDSAIARATLIEKDPEGVKDRLAEWTAASGDSPAVIGALARRAAARGEVAETRRLLELYAAQSPELWAFQALARTYKDKGDIEGWKATLDRFLQAPDEKGLDHARVEVEIAEELMARNQWKEAWPYAEAAADTWAAWAMQCAERCAEGMKDYETAELWYRREAERYPVSWARWYFFCKRTGRGDPDAARAHAEEFLRRLGDRPDLRRPDLVATESLAYYYWLDGQPAKALRPVQQIDQQNPEPTHCAYTIILADMAGDAPARAGCLQAFRQRYANQSPKTLAVLELVYDKAASTGAIPDLKAIDKILESIPAERRGNTSFVVGAYLFHHGRPEDATKYLEMSRDGTRTASWSQLIAADLLRKIPGKGGAKK